MVACVTIGPTSAAAQSGPTREECLPYQTAVLKSIPFPDNRLASDWQKAARCLAIALDELKGPIEAQWEKKENPDAWAQFVRATAMIRIVIANKERKDKDPGAADAPNPAIQEYRAQATLDSASSLAFGTRTGDDSARLNATLVFGNVVDNQSVCVAIDHLYDPVLGPDAAFHHVRGRANLLGVISVVAPWAYKENYANILAIWTHMSRQLEAVKDRGDLKQTFDILKNIRTRLDFQDELERKGQQPNRKTSISDAGYPACKSYRPNPKWAGARLKY
jgi:hypothetical protein